MCVYVSHLAATVLWCFAVVVGDEFSPGGRDSPSMHADFRAPSYFYFFGGIFLTPGQVVAMFTIPHKTAVKVS